jgi:hypothetical protein
MDSHQLDQAEGMTLPKFSLLLQYGYNPSQQYASSSSMERGNADFRHATTSHGRLSSDGSDAATAANDPRPLSRKAGHGLLGAFPGGGVYDGRTSTPLMQQERLLGRGAKIPSVDERQESGQDEQVIGLKKTRS